MSSDFECGPISHLTAADGPDHSYMELGPFEYGKAIYSGTFASPLRFNCTVGVYPVRDGLLHDAFAIEFVIGVGSYGPVRYVKR